MLHAHLSIPVHVFERRSMGLTRCLCPGRRRWSCSAPGRLAILERTARPPGTAAHGSTPPPRGADARADAASAASWIDRPRRKSRFAGSHDLQGFSGLTVFVRCGRCYRAFAFSRVSPCDLWVHHYRPSHPPDASLPTPTIRLSLTIRWIPTLALLCRHCRRPPRRARARAHSALSPLHLHAQTYACPCTCTCPCPCNSAHAHGTDARATAASQARTCFKEMRYSG
jgi:hypothetical protein